jgi:FtsP/CotA-like multicopper oxidase with cupredoxin domain
VDHRVLTYSQLRSLDRNPDVRAPGREMQIHLTSNMERYMWSFDGVRFTEIEAPIVFHEGERLRVTLVNDTMMPHPIHLHGMFFELVNGGGDHKPRKHTVIVKPGERLAFDVTADEPGDWAFHCHLLYHMHAGMMQVVSVRPGPMDHSAHSRSLKAMRAIISRNPRRWSIRTMAAAMAGSSRPCARA